MRYFILSLTLIVLAFGCTMQNAGTGTETSTRNAAVVGKVTDSLGQPFSQARVLLVPADYIPGSTAEISEDTTDTDGNYLLLTQTPGLYNILAFGPSDSLLAFVPKQLVNDDTALAETAALLSPGLLTYLPTADQLSARGHLFIMGTIFTAATDSATVTLRLPKAVLPSLYYIDTSDPEPQLLKDSLVVSPDDTTKVFTVLFVTGSGDNLLKQDSTVIANLGNAGPRVIVTADSELSSQFANSFNLVVISSTVNPLVIDTFFTGESVPVLVCRKEMYGLLKMTGNVSGIDFGQIDSQAFVDTRADFHPIIDKYVGRDSLQLLWNPYYTISWGLPGPGAEILATTSDGSALPVIFCYDKGARMSGMDAPAKRVAFLMESPESVLTLNSCGWHLFINAVKWASGQ